MNYDDIVYGVLLFLSLLLGPLFRRSGGFKLFLPAFIGFSMTFATTGLLVWHSMVTVFGFIFLLGMCPPRINLFTLFFSFFYRVLGPYYKYRTFQDFTHWPSDAPPPAMDQLTQQLREAPVFVLSYFILSHFYSIDYVRLDEFYEHCFAYRFFYMVVIFIVFRLRIYSAWKVAECACIAAGLGAYPLTSKPASGEGPTNLKELHSWTSKYDPKHQETAATIHNEVASKMKPPTLLIAPHTTASTVLSGSTELYDFTTIQNISVWDCEFAPTVRDGMRAWNQTVQYWLATNFHKRCLGSKPFRYTWTMLVSAYWHGIHPGYYFSFLTIPLALLAESGLPILVNHIGLPSGSLSFISWLLKMRVLEYCAMGFLLLDAHTTLSYWHSIGFCVHILLLIIWLSSSLVRSLCRRSVMDVPASVPSATEQMAQLSERRFHASRQS